MRFLLLLFPAMALFSQNFHKTEETLGKIRELIASEERGVYLRFGDGDAALAQGLEDSNQFADAQLMLEMRKAFGLNGPNVLKCLCLNCKGIGFEEGMKPGAFEVDYGFCFEMLNAVFPFWGGPIRDVYSMTALAYAATHKQKLCIDFLKFLKRSPCTILVGNANIPQSVKNLLFGKECVFIPTPPKNSYVEIDRIEKECLEEARKREGYQVIVFSMGCSGRPLQRRLWNQLNNVFLFDFGSLMDAVCGWDTRDWIYLNREVFENNRFLDLLYRELGAD